jgi:hypothetical protein
MAKETRSREQKEIDRIFSMMEQAIRLNDYDADDLLFMIADLIPANAVLAGAISNHAADFIKEQNGEHTWTDIVVEAYRRALFDVEASQLYGTSYFIGNLKAMSTFVTGYITGQTMGDQTEVGEEVAAPAVH